MTILKKFKSLHRRLVGVITRRARRARTFVADPELRATFVNTPFVPVRLTPGHTHPHSAALRSAASLHCQKYTAGLGYQPNMIQHSASDARKNLPGDPLIPYWAKDYLVAEDCLPPVPNSIPILIDVDYYMDMEAFLLTKKHRGDTTEQPTLLYSIVPEHAGYEGKDHFYSFRDNKINYVVSGGGNYSHELWNYPDVLTVAGFDFKDRWLGIPKYKLKVYNVEKIRVGDSRYIIGLFPGAVITGIYAYLSKIFSKHEYLERLKPNHANFTVVETMKNSADISIALEGSSFSASFNAEEQAVLRCVAVDCMRDKRILKSATVESYLDPERADRKSAAKLAQAYFSTTDLPPLQRIYAPDRVVKRPNVNYYSFGPSTEHDKKSVKPFMNAIVDGCYAPLCNKSNEIRSIQTRVEAAKTTRAVGTHLLKAMNAFLELLIPRPHRLAPVDYAEVERKQARPAQRNQAREAEQSGQFYGRIVNAFLKREAVQKCSDPRNITPIGAVDKVSYSRFCYAAAEHLKKFPCYAFSKCPQDVATQVVATCRDAQFVTAGDFSRMDGHQCEPGRVLLTGFFRRLFAIGWHKDLNRDLMSQIMRTGRGTFGTKYSTWLTQMSGSPDTSVGNTVVNWFVAFLARYNNGMSARESFRLSANFDNFGGDDSLMREMPEPWYNKAASMMGHNTKCDIFRSGTRGVNFLARIYSPQVWFGNLASMCYPKRAISKFHVAAGLNGNTTKVRRRKLVEKARSFAATDGKTPFVEQFCATVARLADQKTKDSAVRTIDSSWWSQYDNNYPQDNPGGWMDVEMRDSLPGFDFNRATTFLAECKSLDEILDFPKCYPDEIEPINPPAPVTVNGANIDPHGQMAEKYAKTIEELKIPFEPPPFRADKYVDANGDMKIPTVPRRVRRKNRRLPEKVESKRKERKYQVSTTTKPSDEEEKDERHPCPQEPCGPERPGILAPMTETRRQRRKLRRHLEKVRPVIDQASLETRRQPVLRRKGRPILWDLKDGNWVGAKCRASRQARRPHRKIERKCPTSTLPESSMVSPTIYARAFGGLEREEKVEDSLFDLEPERTLAILTKTKRTRRRKSKPKKRKDDKLSTQGSG